MPWAHTLRLWGALALVAGALVGVVLLGERLPAPAPGEAPPSEFSAARAWPTLVELTDSAGVRLPGSEGSRQAREYLMARLRSLPGLEVQLQDTTGTRRDGDRLVAYRARNVLARLSGTSDDGSGALLLAAHYDSPAMSVGAADDAIGVAALLEVARALSVAPRAARTVILAFGDAEEQGLLGADALMRHPWMRDVTTFINLEAAGNAGRSILFQATPGSDEAVRQYVAVSPYPHGSVIGQDIFQGGLIPSGTDFEVYARGGLRGLDVAFYRGGWAYHTALDRAEALDPGSLQQVGANTLALVRALGNWTAPAATMEQAPVYYDVPGYGMVSYSRTIAYWMAGGAITLLVLATLLALASERLRGRVLLAALLAGIRGIVTALVAALAAAALMAFALRHPHAWYAHPWRGVAAYGSIALTALLIAQWRLSTRPAARDESRDDRALASWAASFLILAIPLATLTALGLGSAYLFLWWVAGGGASMLVLAVGERPRWWLASALGLLPGALLTLQVGYLVVELFVPIAGRMPISFPFDLVLAAIVVTMTAILAPPFLALLHLGGRPGAAAVFAGTLGAVSLVLLLFTPPFTPTRPQRLALLHEGDGRTGWLRVRSFDAVGLARATRGLRTAYGAAASTPADTTGRSRWQYGVRDLRLAAPAPSLRYPTVELLSEERTGSGRALELRLRDGGAYSTSLRLAGGRSAVWDVHGAASPGAAAEPLGKARFVATPDSGWTFRLLLDDVAPVTIELEGHHAVLTPTARDALGHLPAWTTVHVEGVARSSARF